MTTLDASLGGGARDCRPCAACCIHLPIPAGRVGPGVKPAGIVCPHRSATGCRIYARLPKPCADFRCAWLHDESWPRAWRPDRSGLMCLREEVTAGLPAAAVYEIYSGALGCPPAAAILEKLRQTTAVIAVIDSRKNRRRLWGELTIHAAEPLVRKPHFLDQQRRQSTGPRLGSQTTR